MQASVLFVCLGNICRSPTAHGVFRHYVRQAGLDHCISVDSAGTGSWHVGEAPDRRTTAVAKQRGYEMRDLRARRVSVKDFGRFDYVLAMDNNNLSELQAMCPPGFHGQLALFLCYSDKKSITEVPDPYYGGDKGFDQVLDLVEDAASGLLQHLRQRLGV